MKKIKVALVGHPNSGKTSIFNNLTGGSSHVGNYPGVTVEKKEGVLKYKGYELSVVDLPGIYGLTARSIDELVARHFIINEKPDVVVNVIDCSNIHRNLYLCVQLMELGVPLVLVFNMHDIAQEQHLLIDAQSLSKLLGSPIVFATAPKNIGTGKILDSIVDLQESHKVFLPKKISYGEEIDSSIDCLEKILSKNKEGFKYPARWIAIKLLEGDNEILSIIKESDCNVEIAEEIKLAGDKTEKIFKDTPESIIAQRRRGFIIGACSETVRSHSGYRFNVSDKIDSVVINKFFGLPIFLVVMWILFKFTFSLSEPFVKLIELGVGNLGVLISGFFQPDGIVGSLFVEGIIGGVGSVIVFVPMIFLLFFAIAALEDSGYLPRASFIMDRFMHKVGLHGRSFIPMLLGFGCTVPAIMATRTIEDDKDRLATILISPFISCSARLPVYMLFAGAFFAPSARANVIFSLYVLGIIVAIVAAKILRKYLFKGEASPFVMELPPYRIPILRGLFFHGWIRTILYLKKAGTVIFLGCIMIWFLSNFPRADINQNHSSMFEQSYAARVGKFIAPVFKPLGFNDWRLSVGLMGGVVAKEIVIGMLGTLYATERTSLDSTKGLGNKLREAVDVTGEKVYNPLVAYAFMVFVLLYIPCLATIAVIKRETNSWRWTLFSIFYTIAVAWSGAFIVYQVGHLLKLG